MIGLTHRKGPALTIVIGVACAVGVLVAMLAMGRRALGNVRPDRLFTAFALGDSRSSPGENWKVVRRFDEGTSRTCMVFTDVDALMSALSRNAYSRIEVMLRSAADLGAFGAALAANPALHLTAFAERQVVAATFKPLNSILVPSATAFDSR